MGLYQDKLKTSLQFNTRYQHREDTSMGLYQDKRKISSYYVAHITQILFTVIYGYG